MKCRDVRRKLVDLTEQGKTPEQEKSVFEHFKSCNKCSGEYHSYLNTIGELDKGKVFAEKFGRDSNDFFMVSLRRKINQEVVQKQKKQLWIWSVIGKIEAGIISLLLIGQFAALQKSAVYQRRIEGLMEKQKYLEKLIFSLKQEFSEMLMVESTIPDEKAVEGAVKNKKVSHPIKNPEIKTEVQSIEDALLAE